MRPENCIGANGQPYARTERYTKLIAMFPQPRTKHIVKPTLERYIQDRLAEVGKSHLRQ